MVSETMRNFDVIIIFDCLFEDNNNFTQTSIIYEYKTHGCELGNADPNGTHRWLNDFWGMVSR